MYLDITRRQTLSALTAGGAVTLVGCGFDETTNDSEVSTEHETLLFIETEQKHVVDSTEVYDGIEIEPTGALLIESGVGLKLKNAIRP